MHILHVIPDLCLDEPQMAVVEFCRVARMRGIRNSVLALSKRGEAVRALLEAQNTSVQTLSSEQAGALQMQLLQAPADAVQTHSEAAFAKVLPAVSDTSLELFHTFHHGGRGADALPGGSGYVDRAVWVDGVGGGEAEGDDNELRSATILDGVWSPPIESLEPASQRRELGVDEGSWVIGASGLSERGASIEVLGQMREHLGGADVRIVLFGGDPPEHELDGFTFVSSDDPQLIERLGGVDIFVQLRDRAFSLLTLLAMARRAPVIMPEPSQPEAFRGGWRPLRFSPPDAADLADKVSRYICDPDMHDAHRSMVRDYVLTYRDSMSMVADYARLYATLESTDQRNP